MRVCFWHSDKPRERLLADAFIAGVKAHGDEGFARPLLPEPELAECDVAVMVGVKSRPLFRMHWSAGIHLVYMDKGYTRHAARSPVKLWEFWRVAIDAHQPTEYLMREDFPADRWAALGLEFNPWRVRGAHIVLAGSSAKYHEFYGLTEPTTYYRKVIRHLRQVTSLPIIYRPKPSWRDASPIEGAEYSVGGSIDEVLRGAHVLVTHGSNACFEAVLAGVPCVVLGDAAARPLGSVCLEGVNSPKLANLETREKWGRALAYCQWTMREFHDGAAWNYLRPRLLR